MSCGHAAQSRINLMNSLVIFSLFSLRGQESGHDIDLLMTHKVPGEEKHILGHLMEKLGKLVTLDHS